MNHPEGDRAEELARPAPTRRNVLKAMGVGGAAAAAAPLLAACGGSSNKSTSGSSAAATSGTVKGSNSAEVQKIKNFVPIDAAHAAKGQTLNLGVVLAFTGAGAFFGRVMSQGCKLAGTHIEALGGPKFNFIFKDHKSGDPQAGVNAVKELGFAKVPMMLASYVDDLGAMLPGQAQYKIFTMDGGGGTSTFAQGKPYFWGMRAITPNDAVPGAAKYVNEQLKAKKVTLMGWDLGSLNKAVVDDVTAKLKKQGMSLAGPFIPTKVNATDYLNYLQKAKTYSDADILFVSIYGNDPGYFMKQYVTSGINKPVVIFEFTSDAAKVAGNAYDGVYFAYDFFNPAKPDNGWSKIFIDEYKSAYGVDPDFYAANYYEDTFAMWEVVQRVVKAGGDLKDGTQLDKAMRSNLTFKSVYGGDETTAGELALSPDTHSVTRRPMSISQFKSGQVDPKAYFNLNAADYKLA